MSSPFHTRIDEFLADYQEQRRRLADMQREVDAVTATAKAPRQVVAVTVGARGDITDVAFPTDAYRRLAPAELSATLMKTIGEARALYDKRTAEVTTRYLEADDLWANAVGAAGVQDLVPETPGMPDAVRQYLARGEEGQR